MKTVGRAVLALVLLLLAAGLAPAQDDFGCDDFASQAAAQATLDQDPTDPYGLDPDGNQVACDVVPAPSNEEPAGPSAPSGRHGGPRVPGLPLRWSATSPATHLGDEYRLVVTNVGTTPQRLLVRTVVMDHATHTITLVLDEPLTLGPGERRELTATNRYGTANHFSTGVASETRELTLAVTIKDAEGVETARFNERAFRVEEAIAFRFRLPRQPVAAFFGLAPAGLRAAQDQGLSLGDIAVLQGADREALRQFLIGLFEEQLQQALAAGELAPEQADTLSERFRARLDARIDRGRQPDRGHHEHGTAGS